MRFTPNPYSATILGQPFCDAVTRKTNQVWQQSTKQSVIEGATETSNCYIH